MSRIVYGLKPVLEALRARPGQVAEIILAEGQKPGRLQEILSLVRGGGVKVRRRPREELTRLAGTADHQGVVAVVGDFEYLSLPELLARPGLELVVLLDGLQDPQNRGAAARSALAAGAGGLIIPKNRAAGVTPVAVKASAGALNHLPVARVTNLNQAAEELKAAGFWILGAAPSAPVSLFDLPDPAYPLAVAVGAEGRGLSRLLGEKCDFLVSIPLSDPVESLNAAAAAAVVLFELKRRRIRAAAGRGDGPC